MMVKTPRPLYVRHKARCAIPMHRDANNTYCRALMLNAKTLMINVI